MARAQIFTGTWDELNAHSAAFRHRKTLTLIIPAEGPVGAPTAKDHFYLTPTPEEFRRAFDALGEDNEDSPVLPAQSFDRENLYDEDRF